MKGNFVVLNSCYYHFFNIFHGCPVKKLKVKKFYYRILHKTTWYFRSRRSPLQLIRQAAPTSLKCSNTLSACVQEYRGQVSVSINNQNRRYILSIISIHVLGWYFLLSFVVKFQKISPNLLLNADPSNWCPISETDLKRP